MKRRWVVLIVAAVSIGAAGVVDAAMIGSKDTATPLRRAGVALPSVSAQGASAPAAVRNLHLVSNDGARFTLAWADDPSASVFEVYPDGGDATRVGVTSVTLNWPSSAHSVRVRVAAVSAAGAYSSWASLIVDPTSQPPASPPVTPPTGIDAAGAGHGGSHTTSGRTSAHRWPSAEGGQTSTRPTSGSQRPGGEATTGQPTSQPTTAPTSSGSRPPVTAPSGSATTSPSQPAIDTPTPTPTPMPTLSLIHI